MTTALFFTWTAVWCCMVRPAPMLHWWWWPDDMWEDCCIIHVRCMTSQFRFGNFIMHWHSIVHNSLLILGSLIENIALLLLKKLLNLIYIKLCMCIQVLNKTRVLYSRYNKGFAFLLFCLPLTHIYHNNMFKGHAKFLLCPRFISA